MAKSDNKLSPLEILHSGPVIPVIVLHNADHALPLAEALLAERSQAADPSRRGGRVPEDGAHGPERGTA